VNLSFKFCFFDFCPFVLKFSSSSSSSSSSSFFLSFLLSWHVVDGDSFPIVSKTFPELSEKGAFAPEAVYTPEAVQSIIKYAKDRGVRVVPEFDVPGHSSIGYAHPELVGCPEFYKQGVGKRQMVGLDPVEEKTYSLLSGLFKEMELAFPDNFMHLGGDEVRQQCWETKPSLQEQISSKKFSSFQDLEKHFWKKLSSEVLSTMNKTFLVWVGSYFLQQELFHFENNSNNNNNNIIGRCLCEWFSCAL